VNIFFDVDSTIIGDDGSLRPHTREIFEQLVREGHHVYIWSGVGIRTAEIEAHGLAEYVSGVFQKPRTDFQDGLTRFGIPVTPHFVVDDYPQIVEHFGGHQISPYYDVRYRDTELLHIPRKVEEMRRALEEAEIQNSAREG
jgi:phosphoglycolate phosphatase-like HAD superfamily hydrolase